MFLFQAVQGYVRDFPLDSRRVSCICLCIAEGYQDKTVYLYYQKRLSLCCFPVVLYGGVSFCAYSRNSRHGYYVTQNISRLSINMGSVPMFYVFLSISRSSLNINQVRSLVIAVKSNIQMIDVLQYIYLNFSVAELPSAGRY